MALPAHLAEFDGLIDIVVDVLVRDFQDAQMKTPPGSRLPDGAKSSNTSITDYPSDGETDGHECTPKISGKQTGTQKKPRQIRDDL